MEQIKELTALLQRVSEIKAELNSVVIKTAMDVAIFEQKKYPNSDHPSSERSFDDWDFSSDGFVNVNWSESWSYGGHADGIISFPISFLSNPELFQEFKDSCIEAKRARDDNEAMQRRNNQLAEFERLKKELGKS